MSDAVMDVAIDVVARGPKAEAARDYAVAKVRRAMETAGAPVLYGRIKLGEAADPAVERPALAEAMLDVNGRPVRARVAASTMTEAVDLLEERLRERVRHRVDRLRTRRRRGPASVAGEWRHSQAAAAVPAAPSWVERPAEERRVVRHKTLAPEPMAPDEAAFDMEMLDVDWYLYTDLATGDAVVLWGRPGGGHETVAPVPGLSLDDAVERLEAGGEPFVAYLDGETGRARVLYRRYDGNYGLVTTPEEPAPPAEPATARRRLRDELERLEAVRAAVAVEHFDEESAKDSVGEMSSADQHPADLGTETFERERGLSQLADLDGRIDEVRRALVRVGRGTYGRCEVCGAEIPDERLIAVPAARFCLEHQAVAEVMPGVTTPPATGGR
jgi:RNA polymerase-binding transcription factor DksA/ribosome-associated translation inhibitor RaiA